MSGFAVRRVVAAMVLLTAIAAIAVATGRQATPARAAGASVSQFGNGRIVFASERGGERNLYLMSANGVAQTRLTTGAGDDDAPAWSPDGARIAYSSLVADNRDIYVVNSDGSARVRLTTAAGDDSSPSWSPDGTRIAFSSVVSGNQDIWVMNRDGSHLTRLTSSPGNDVQPAWSPDGTRIAFSSVVSGNQDIWVMNADGSQLTRLTSSPGDDIQPAWSPDGTRIAFSANADICVMNADGSHLTRISDSGSDLQPAWSPDDGTNIVFTSARSGNQEVFVMQSDGRHPHDLTNRASPDTQPSWQPLAASAPSGSPVKHVVIVYQENHSFDNVLGRFCAQTGGCDGATTGKLYGGQTIPLATASDLVHNVGHSGDDQTIAEDDRKMDGFSRIVGCKIPPYKCYTQYSESGIPNVWALASAFTVSDRTFEQSFVPSWQAHLELATSLLDGFSRDTTPRPRGDSPGWGCDSGDHDGWRATPWKPYRNVPSCVPRPDGSGAYRTTPVPWVPTIMDRMDAAGLSWRIYTPGPGVPGYGWAICPTFADCLNTSQHQNQMTSDQFAVDAAAGNLPSLSILIPGVPDSQHNRVSMLQGDNWIGKNVTAVENGPDWNSSAVFITWDDCGCFYDHVPPPPKLGIRVPMVIVSPFSRPGFTDSSVASYASLLAFYEHTFGLAPLSPADAEAYDYSRSFDYSQTPLPPIPLKSHRISRKELRYIAAHPPRSDDPT